MSLTCYRGEATAINKKNDEKQELECCRISKKEDTEGMEFCYPQIEAWKPKSSMRREERIGILRIGTD